MLLLLLLLLLLLSLQFIYWTKWGAFTLPIKFNSTIFNPLAWLVTWDLSPNVWNAGTFSRIVTTLAYFILSAAWPSRVWWSTEGVLSKLVTFNGAVYSADRVRRVVTRPGNCYRLLISLKWHASRRSTCYDRWTFAVVLCASCLIIVCPSSSLFRSWLSSTRNALTLQTRSARYFWWIHSALSCDLSAIAELLIWLFKYCHLSRHLVLTPLAQLNSLNFVVGLSSQTLISG